MYSAPSAHPQVLFRSAFFSSVYYSILLLSRSSTSQQVKGADSAPLFWSGEIPPGVLCPALEHSAQESHRPVGAGPEEGSKK